MKQKRSMDEAISAARELREKLNQPASQPEQEQHLKVVGQSPDIQKNSTSQNGNSENAQNLQPEFSSTSVSASSKPVWVRHTIGLRDTTSLNLRDAADGQKRKERHGRLLPGEPANEQEIADLGIRLALKQLGYLDQEKIEKSS